MHRSTTRPTTRLAGAAALAISGALALSGCAGASGPQRDAEGKVTQEATVSITQLKIGDCFNTSDSGQAQGPEDTEVDSSITVVPCTQAHTDEIYATGQLTGSTLPEGDDMELQRAGICEAPLHEYVGNPKTDIEYFVYGPLDASSYATNKTVTCAIGLSSGDSLYRSAKGIKTMKALTAPVS